MKLILVAVLVLGLVVVAGCGGTVGTTTTAPATTGSTAAPSTTAAPTTSTAGKSATLDEYRAAVQGWLDEYVPKVNDALDAVESITDPLNPTADELNGAQVLAGTLADSAKAFADIVPTADLESAHQGFLQALQGMTAGAQQLYDGLKAKDAAKVLDAFGAIAAAGEGGEPAQTALQEALGIDISE